MLDTEVDYNKVNTEFQREKWGLSRFFLEISGRIYGGKC